MPESTHVMPGDGVSQVLFDAVMLLDRRISRHLRGTGLHWGLRRILQQLWIRDGLSQKDLAAAARITPTSASNMLKHLIAGGWVERRQDDYDYRVSRIYVAERGLELKRIVETNASIGEALSDDAAVGLRAHLDRMIDVLRDICAEEEGVLDDSTPPGEL
jgi:DNA-binding MarR family transcriptional regulator